MFTNRWMTLLAALALGLSVSSGAARAAGESRPTAAPRLPSIYVITAKREPITDTVQASGYVRPVEDVYVQPQVEGLAVESTDIEIGQSVDKGEVMAVLSDAALKLQLGQLKASEAKAEGALAQGRAQLAEAQANADQAVRVRDRYAELKKSGTVATANVDEASANADAALARVNSAKQNIAVAKADVSVAQAQIDDVHLRLSRTRVKAPVAGLVSAKNLKIGAIASASGDPLFTIIKDGRLELRADVSEEDLLKLHPGETTAITLPGRSEPLGGTVRLVDPTVDLSSRLGTVRIAIDRPENARAGMFANATITVASKTSVVLPISAVNVADDRASVLKVGDDGIVAMTPVVTGIEQDGRIEIAKGVDAGDRIVAKAGAFVRDGDHIHPVALPAHGTSTADMAATLDN